MRRAALFGVVGIAFFLHWTLVDPSFDETEEQAEWLHVLAFSGVLLLLAVAVPAAAFLLRGCLVRRLALVAAAGAVLAGIANIVEDGLQVGFAFFLFVLGTAIMTGALFVLAAVLGAVGRGKQRLLALIPAGTLAGVVLYVFAGGPLLLATWLTAAVLAMVFRAGAGRPAEAAAQ